MKKKYYTICNWAFGLGITALMSGIVSCQKSEAAEQVRIQKSDQISRGGGVKYGPPPSLDRTPRPALDNLPVTLNGTVTDKKGNIIKNAVLNIYGYNQELPKRKYELLKKVNITDGKLSDISIERNDNKKLRIEVLSSDGKYAPFDTILNLKPNISRYNLNITLKKK